MSQHQQTNDTKQKVSGTIETVVLPFNDFNTVQEFHSVLTGKNESIDISGITILLDGVDMRFTTSELKEEQPVYTYPHGIPGFTLTSELKNIFFVGRNNDWCIKLKMALFVNPMTNVAIVAGYSIRYKQLPDPKSSIVINLATLETFRLTHIEVAVTRFDTGTTEQPTHQPKENTVEQDKQPTNSAGIEGINENTLKAVANALLKEMATLQQQQAQQRPCMCLRKPCACLHMPAGMPPSPHYPFMAVNPFPGAPMFGAPMFGAPMWPNNPSGSSHFQGSPMYGSERFAGVPKTKSELIDQNAAVAALGLLTGLLGKAQATSDDVAGGHTIKLMVVNRLKTAIEHLNGIITATSTS